MAATEAKIKFSSEKSKFFTTNVKVLGYSFDTSNVQLTMDKVKASGIMNTKKPSSLYELHSRLASFQYQSMFLPNLQFQTQKTTLYLQQTLQKSQQQDVYLESKTERWNQFQSHQNILAQLTWENVHTSWKVSAWPTPLKYFQHTY